jgi:pyruvate dehydrogenase (quinone)
MIRALTQVLQIAGIDHIYGVGDDTLKPIAEATRAAGGIAWFELANEEAAACAAADDAEITGALAVCAGGYGIGRTSLIPGLRDAHRGGAPVLALALHIAPEPGRDRVISELHPAHVFSGCSNYCGVIEDPSQVPQLARAAMQHALVRGGVSVLLLDSVAVSASRPRVARGAALRLVARGMGERRPCA